jgi:hypothetical protein
LLKPDPHVGSHNLGAGCYVRLRARRAASRCLLVKQKMQPDGGVQRLPRQPQQAVAAGGTFDTVPLQRSGSG